MATRTETIKINLDISGLRANAAAAKKSIADAAGTKLPAYAQKNAAALGQVSKAAGIMGAALVASAGLAVKTFADWDSKMAQVKSLSHASAADMQQLKTATMGFAKQFGISATQAADAEIELVKAGVSVKDIMGGALKGALTLASAGQMDVADATEIAASAMTQFGLKGKDVSHIADLLAAGADKALGSVSDLGQGLKYVGPVAAGLNISIEQTVGTLSELAQNGILADQAGTSLRGMLQALVAPSREATKVMDTYGISVYDAQGKFVGFDGIAEQLSTKLGKLDDATKQQALGQIFGNQQITAATVLMKDGAKGVDDWTKAVNDQGFAAEQASGKMDSLSGDLEKFKASLTNALIGTGAGANSPLRGLVQGATDLVDAFNKLPGPMKTATLALVGGGGLVALGVAGLAKVIQSVGTLKKTVDTLGASFPRATKSLGSLGKAAGIAAAAFTTFEIAAQIAGSGLDKIASQTQFESTLKKIGSSAKDSGESVSDAKKKLDDLFTVSGSGAASITGVGNAIKTLNMNKFIQTWDTVGSLFGVFDSDQKLAKKAVSEFDDAITALAESGDVEDVASSLKYYQEQANKAGVSTEKAMALLPNYNDYLTQQADATKSAADATDVNAVAAQEAAKKFQASEEAVAKWAKGVSDNAGAFLDFSQDADTAKLSLDGWIQKLDGQASDLRDWAKNIKKAAENGVSKGVLTELAKLGPEERPASRNWRTAPRSRSTRSTGTSRRSASRPTTSTAHSPPSRLRSRSRWRSTPRARRRSSTVCTTR
ncbi:hypothetical protein GCM10025864_39620 [Luteimicrobium album]|uniref:Phage tail tape measure protein domain-containing protein n=1 Tax=Luteimicrobium album TaxID=1054550 RepID=A0ABQ6I5Y9_9MICO|nr:phage tail tape measure protein [Luteimicrobium album]GMA26203.1 hypothetical protein GCM10025864_39620 [Luteimicrobium album]